MSESVLILKTCNIEMKEAANKNFRRVTANISKYVGRIMNMMISGRCKRYQMKLLKLRIVTTEMKYSLNGLTAD